MKEKVILDNDEYRVIFKQHSEEDEFDLFDVVYNLIEVTKEYELWLCWIATLKNKLDQLSQEVIEKFRLARGCENGEREDSLC